MNQNSRDMDLLKTNALETAQRLIDYESYGGKRAKALAALRRRTPGYEKTDYKAWLDEAIATHQRAIVYTRENAERFFKIFERNPKQVNFAGHIEDFENQNPKFSPEQLNGVLVFAFYLYHLR